MAQGKVSSPLEPKISIPTRKTNEYQYDLGPKQSQGNATIANHTCDHPAHSPNATGWHDEGTRVLNPKLGKGDLYEYPPSKTKGQGQP